MAATFRLSPDLHKRAGIYAERMGISVNALIAVSLDEYLRLRGDELDPPPNDPDAAISEAEPRSQGSGGHPPPNRVRMGGKLSRQQRRKLKRERMKRER